MDNRGYKHYQEQSLDTMTSGELLIMLYDGLLKKLIQAQILMNEKNYKESEKIIDKCLDIVHYLQNTLDYKYPISRDLRKLYEFFCFTLMRVKIGHNANELERVKRHVTDLRDSFKQADKNAVAQTMNENETVPLENKGGAES